MTLLTKSKYMIGLQCPQYLWIALNAKDQIPEPDAATQHAFDQGNKIGELATKWFPEGIDLSKEGFKPNLEKTKEAITTRKPIFEAGFLKENLFSRIDILNPVNNEWDIIEVKSSTKVKEEHYHDVSFQKLCAEKAGLKIRKCFLMHINNEYVKEGEINPKQLLIQEDITEEVIKASNGIEERISTMFKTIALKEMPDITIGKHCLKPYECPITQDCWKFLPKENIFKLYRGGDKAWKLFEEGIYKIEDIPDEFKLTDKQQLQRDCAKTGKTHIQKEAIKHFLSSLKYPLYYLDFETINPAIPLFDGTKPYQQIPFQYSLHVVQEDGKREHFGFLAEGTDDPRDKFAKELKKVLGDNGDIIVYNQSFEISRLKEIAEAFPSFNDWVQNVLTRIVDLLVPFRNFSYYNPQQEGSASIKKVLPAVTGKGYSELEINNGASASMEYERVTYGEASDREKVRANLIKYCTLDTEGMVWIVEELGKLVK